MRSRQEMKLIAKQTAFSKEWYWKMVLATLILSAVAYSSGINSNQINFVTQNSDGMTMSINIPLVALGGLLSMVSMAGLFLEGAIRPGYYKYCRMALSGNQPQIGEIFSYFRFYGKSLGLHMLITLYVFLWSLLFIVPGIVAAYRYSLAHYIFMLHPEYSVRECMDESKRLMDGYKGQRFGLDMSFFGWGVLSALTLGVLNVFYVGPYYGLTSVIWMKDRLAADERYADLAEHDF